MGGITVYLKGPSGDGTEEALGRLDDVARAPGKSGTIIVVISNIC